MKLRAPILLIKRSQGQSTSALYHDWSMFVQQGTSFSRRAQASFVLVSSRTFIWPKAELRAGTISVSRQIDHRLRQSISQSTIRKTKCLTLHVGGIYSGTSSPSPYPIWKRKC